MAAEGPRVCRVWGVACLGAMVCLALYCVEFDRFVEIFEPARAQINKSDNINPKPRDPQEYGSRPSDTHDIPKAVCSRGGSECPGVP